MGARIQSGPDQGDGKRQEGDGAGTRSAGNEATTCPHNFEGDDHRPNLDPRRWMGVRVEDGIGQSN